MSLTTLICDRVISNQAKGGPSRDVICIYRYSESAYESLHLIPLIHPRYEYCTTRTSTDLISRPLNPALIIKAQVI